MKWIFLCSLFLLTACEELAIHSTPKKQAKPSYSVQAIQAQNLFWKTLHEGNYQNIPLTQTQLMAAYLENPNDPLLAAHLGFLHLWVVTERQRLKNIPPTIVDNVVLSKYYFSDAIELDPYDARYLGFYADSILVSGQVFKNEREQVRGYFTLKRAIQQWPEFNYFTGGYVMSTLPSDSKHFQEGLEWQWKTLDLCAGQKMDRQNPDFKPFMKYETKIGPKRACWNSWIAPFNFEGFFMNMGDMLVKAGDWKTAVTIYQNAKLDRHYSKWPFKKILETKINNAKNNVVNFQKDYISPTQTILFNSGYGCVACHQSSRT